MHGTINPPKPYTSVIYQIPALSINKVRLARIWREFGEFLASNWRKCITLFAYYLDEKENTNMAEFASNGKGNAALTTGIIGTSLGGLLALGNGLLNGGMMRGSSCCNEDHFVNRYEAQKNQEISTLEMENALLKAEKNTDQKSLEMYKYVDGRFREFEQAIAQQAVYNATNTSTIACLQNQVLQLQSLTKMVIPADNVCPQPMAKYNSWTAPTTTTTA